MMILFNNKKIYLEEERILNLDVGNIHAQL